MLAVFVITGLSLFSWYTYQEVQSLRGGEPEMQWLRQLAARQQVQIYAFADKVRLLENQMAKLRQFDYSLRAKTGKIDLQTPSKGLALGGSDDGYGPSTNVKSKTAELVRGMHRDLDRLLAETSVLEVSQARHGEALEDSKSIMASSPVYWPLYGKMTSTFGYRDWPFGARGEFHRGIDIQAPIGTPILAPADGVVVSVDWNSGYGQILAVNHGYGILTRYAHLTQSYVEPGQYVRRGQRIAAVGATGRVTGPHLHYEVILNGIPVNPMRFLAAKK